MHELILGYHTYNRHKLDKTQKNVIHSIQYANIDGSAKGCANALTGVPAVLYEAIDMISIGIVDWNL